MYKLFIFSLIFSFKILATDHELVIKDQLTNSDVEQWSEKISQMLLGYDPDNVPKMIKFLSDMQNNNNNSIMQKAYSGLIIFHTLKFFEGYFSSSTEGQGLVEIKETIENDPMYWSMLKFTKIIYNFLSSKKNETYVKHDNILIFYKKYRQFSYVFGIMPMANNNDVIYLPFVQELINNEKIKIISIFSVLDCSPIELYIRNKKIMESNCLFIVNRGLFNVLVFYSGKFTANPFCRCSWEHFFANISFKNIKNIAEEMNATKWDENSYYVELFSSEFERLGFLESFSNSDFVQENFLEYSESENFEDHIDYKLILTQEQRAENDITMISEYEKMLQEEWEAIKKRVVQDSKNASVYAKSKAKKNRYVNKKGSTVSSSHQQNQINEAFNKRVKEIKNEIKSGRQKFRDIKKFINQTIKLSDKPIHKNQEGSHIVLSVEGKSPLTIVKFHNGKTISSNEGHKMFDDLINFLF